MSLNIVTGGLPPLRQWANYGSFIDVTDNASDLNKLSLTWTTQRNDEAEYVPGANQPKKSASGTIRIEGTAFDLLRNWLVNDVSAALNSVDVKVLDENCGYYENYIIRSNDIQECEGQSCVYDVILKQKDEALNCIKRTLVSDNWQGWFNNRIDPTDPGAKRHPRFSYCNEIRPNGMMIMQWYIAIMTMTVTGIFMISLLPIINTIIAILWVIDKIIDLGDIPKPISLGDLLESFQQYFIESAGCGREHPAPLIRDYIKNVCDKCGIEVDHVTAPIFFNTIMYSPTGSFESASGDDITGDLNPHYNACYFYAPIERGVRRFRSLNLLNDDPDNETFYLPDNRPLLMLDQFLDQIKGMYNAEWFIKNNKLYFWRKDWFFTAGQYIYDFTAKSPDRDKILEGVCFEPTDRKYPAFVQGIYALDASDSCGREAQKFQDGSYSFGNKLQNPNYEGKLDKTQQFGAAKFRLDGASTDYVYDALQVISNSTAFTFPFINGAIRDFIYPAFDEYADYALLLSDETAALPKILIWDGESYTNAKVSKPRSGWPDNNNWGLAVPDINPKYPTIFDNGTISPLPWIMKHFPQTYVRGSKLSFGSYPIGTYKVQDYFGIDLASKPALLVNYPMYFEPHFKGTLWDWFHYIDDPERNPRLNKNWNVKIALCCEDLQLLQVFLDASNIRLGEKVKLPNVYNADGIITEITVSYNFSDNLGMYIEIKGIV